ncbi:hypothetical protein PMI06_005486 [Burkholderia sp. BT03]|nr:hypothetical protein PMI06_005486 [Burkholderia sp. BT03]SKC81568.1 hypothetical protein SAMN06266956_3774 [Paraburkholderia hospita]
MKNFAVSLLAACRAVVRTGVSYGKARPQVVKMAQPSADTKKNQPGDILDNQVFVTYRSPLEFSLKVPEGWARRETLQSVEFANRYNRISVTVGSRTCPLTLEDVKSHEVRELQRSGNDVHVSHVKVVRLPSGNAFVVRYASGSARNPVTNDAIRRENARYLFSKDGKLATLTLSAPSGSDNADQWQLMAQSFGWY